MKLYGYSIEKRGKHQYKIGDGPIKWSEFSEWECWSRKIYIHEEIAINALKQFEESTIYNNEFTYNEFRIIKLYSSI